MPMQSWKKPRTKWMSFTPAGPSWRKNRRESLRSGCQTEGNDRVSTLTCTLFEFREQALFHVVWIRLHLAGGNFFHRRALKAQFANAQAVLRAHGRTKHPAGHRSRFVKFAVSRLRIERRTRFIVGKIGEPVLGLFSLIQHAGDGIVGKLR